MPAKEVLQFYGLDSFFGRIWYAIVFLWRFFLDKLIFFTPIMSSVSVIMQRYYFKLTHGKRIFLMSPVHHHFEKKGYTETQIVSMYAGVTLLLSLAAVISVCAALR